MKSNPRTRSKVCHEYEVAFPIRPLHHTDELLATFGLGMQRNKIMNDATNMIKYKKIKIIFKHGN